MKDVHIDNLAIARKAYSGFGKGVGERDLSSFFERLADDVSFRYAAAPGTPISGELRGKAAVVEYHTHSSASLVMDLRLEGPLEFVGSGSRVVVLGSESYTIRKTGAEIRDRDFAIVLNFRCGLITGIVLIKDLSEFSAAYMQC